MGDDMQDEPTDAKSAHKGTGREADPVSREELYSLVWAKPMLRVAEDFGVSSSYMARVCTELRVPRPAQGYWTQVELGRAPERPALPPVRHGDVSTWRPGATVGTVEQTVKKIEAKARAQEGPPGERAKRGRPRAKPSGSTVHLLVKDVKPHFLKSRDTDTGLLRPFKRMLVDVVTSEAQLDRVLGVANALFSALTAKGHRVAFGSLHPHMGRMEVNVREVPKKNQYHQPVWAPDRPTVLYIGAMPIGLTFYEMTEDVESVYANGTYFPVRDLTAEQRRRFTGPQHWKTTKELPSGRLCLQAYYPSSSRVKWFKRWQETPVSELLDVPKMVAALEASVPELTEQIETARIQEQEQRRLWEEQQRQWREERERERRQKAHQAAQQELIAAIAEWDQARKVEAYFEDVLRAAEHMEAGERDTLVDRVTQARAMVSGPSALDALLRWKSPSERL